jgi:cobalt/nickel transport system permease protein
MSKINEAIYHIRQLDDLALKDSVIHRIHPVAKFITLLAYLITVISFGRYEIVRLIPFVFYPMVLILLADLPAGPILKRLLMTEPLIIGVGILNPIFDPNGWTTFASIMFKCALTVTAGLVLVATTGMERIGQALRALRLPKLFVLQILLTYRYISLLIEELAKILRAYRLRAPKMKGVRLKDSGSLAGHLLIRTYDRALRVNEAMKLRGFQGEYHSGNEQKMIPRDIAYLLVWSMFFAAIRIFDIPTLLGSIWN